MGASTDAAGARRDFPHAVDAALLRGGFELLEAIAVVVDRHYAVAGFGLEIELFSHLADVGVDGAGGEVAAAPPDSFLQVAARQQPADVAEERHGQLELLRRQLELVAVLAHLAALDVDLDWGERKLLLLLDRIGAPQQRAYAGDELLPAY